ncbi:hypothetical protein [Embleya sp. AB8]|uniref:hypothetical protein n=1 Tax=Embleya sp. AB8 TaxID=3156304 RepID=UPI003C751AA7
MPSINRLLGPMLLGAGLAMAVPATAHALPAGNPVDCAQAVAAAAKAQLQYDAAVVDLGRDAAGGRPDRARQEQVERAKTEMNATASTAARLCPDVKAPAHEGTSTDKGPASSAENEHGTPPEHAVGHVAAPSGSMDTGGGSTSDTPSGSEIAVGAALFATGAGLALRRLRGR